MSEVTVREAVLHLLRSFGMTTIFGNPGSTELPMFRTFPEDFRYVLALQESIVLAMADGFAQATRNAALVNLHSAAGLGNALGNLFTAFRNGTPLVVTAGQQARSILPYEPYLFAQQATEFPKPYVKWSCEPARAQDVPAAIARAYYLSMQAPTGPTFVSIPVDDWDRTCELLEPREIFGRTTGEPAALTRVAQTLAACERPVLVVGAGLAREDVWDDTIALAERHNAPVWVSPMSARNSFPEDHRLFAGFLPASRERIVDALRGHDLVLVLGGPLFTYHVEGFGPHLAQGTDLVQLIDDPSGAAWLPVGMSVITNLQHGVAHLLEGPLPSSRIAPTPAPAAPRLTSGFSDAFCLQQIASLMPTDAIIVEEAPSSRSAMHEYLPIRTRDGFYTGASGGLGHGLPAAIGIALGRPDTKVIAILGDGSAMYAIQGLWSAAQLGLPISFVILNNRKYQALVEFGQHFRIERTIGTDLDGIDFCQVASGLGMKARRVDRLTDLDDALVSSFSDTAPTLLELVITPAASPKVPSRQPFSKMR